MYAGAGGGDQGADRLTAAGAPAAGCVRKLRHAVRPDGHTGGSPHTSPPQCCYTFIRMSSMQPDKVARRQHSDSTQMPLPDPDEPGWTCASESPSQIQMQM